MLMTSWLTFSEHGVSHHQLWDVQVRGLVCQHADETMALTFSEHRVSHHQLEIAQVRGVV